MSINELHMISNLKFDLLSDPKTGECIGAEIMSCARKWYTRHQTLVAQWLQVG